MGNTTITISGNNFFINGSLTYSDIKESPIQHHGLLMNARFIQGIFDDKANPSRFNRYGKIWNPSTNTKELIKALPQWKAAGLLAFTVGLQGGMPVLTIKNSSIDNNPFSEEGSAIDPAYLERLDLIIRAADAIGMVVIVSILYEGQINRLKAPKAIRNTVKTTCNYLRNNHYTNVIVEVANEYTVGEFYNCPTISDPHNMCKLIALARKESGGMLVGSSSGGLWYDKEVIEASDIAIIHGNGGTRETYHRFVKTIKELAPNKPILCNEDSPRFSQLRVAFDTHTSWGYYNTHTKQEVPTYWGITRGEDTFFAKRLSDELGIPWDNKYSQEEFLLQGLGNHETYNNSQWIRLAALYPEKIDYVTFYRDNEYMGLSYEEPFYLNSTNTWYQEGVALTGKKEMWQAKVHLHDGTVTVVNGVREAMNS